MAKQQTRTATKGSEDLIRDATSRTNEMLGGFGQDRDRSKERQTNLFNDLTGAINQQRETGGFQNLPGLRSNVENIINTGGYDTDRFNSLYENFGKTDYDPEMLGTVRGGLTNFAETGGYDPRMRQDFLRQSTSGTQGVYKTLADRVMQDRGKTGGVGTGGETSQMARQLGQEAARSTLAAKTGLDKMVTENKFSGLQGLGTLMDSQGKLRLAGLGCQAGLLSDQAGGRRTGVGQQIGLESGVAAGTNAANVLASRLYDTTTGEVSDLGDKMIKSLGLQFATREQALSILQRLSLNPSMLQQAFNNMIEYGKLAKPSP